MIYIALIAGFADVVLLNEPIAASVVYATNRYLCHEEAENEDVQKENITAEIEKLKNGEEIKDITIDKGGGTFDVCVLSTKQIRSGEEKEEQYHYNMQCISIAGDNKLGGQDVTRALTKHVKKTIEEKYNFKFDLNNAEHKDYLSDLFIDMDNHKKTFVNKQTQQYKMHSLLIEGALKRDIITIPYTKFLDICGPIIKRTEMPIWKALFQKKLSPEDIDHINLMGGGSRVPFLQSTIKKIFGSNCNIRIDEDVDQTVAKGCSIFAYQYYNENVDVFIVKNILPISLGIQARNYNDHLRFFPILRRGM